MMALPMTIGMSSSFQHASRTPAPPPSSTNTTTTVLKSQSIPISGVHRTASEVQLCEDEALADYRDYVVFSRIVNHHLERRSQQQQQQQQQQHSHNSHHKPNPYWQHENDKCLAHVLSTRNEPHQQDTLQSLSHHIAQSQAPSPPPPVSSSDDYYCGEDPPTTTTSNGEQGNWILSDMVEDALTLDDDPQEGDDNDDEDEDHEDEGIFSMEL